MSELPPKEPLETVYLGNRTLRYWHSFLTTDMETGENTSSVEIHDSRYGTTAGAAAYWAIAAAVVLEHADGTLYEPEAVISLIMSDVVNDQPDVATIVRDYFHQVPVELQEMLDWEGVDNR